MPGYEDLAIEKTGQAEPVNGQHLQTGYRLAECQPVRRRNHRGQGGGERPGFCLKAMKGLCRCGVVVQLISITMRHLVVIMTPSCNVVGGFANDNYWSSSENDSNNAWNQNFNNKNNTLRVRRKPGRNTDYANIAPRNQ